MDSLRLVSILALLFTTEVSVHCVQLDRNGGYHIVVAIADSEAEAVGSVAEANEYINSVKEMLGNFGTVLWTATNFEFSLKSAQVLIPASWSDTLGVEANVSITATYGGADVEVSGDTEEPVTENYYPCGKPGVRIRLPVWFLDCNRTRADFGSQSKGLLSLWLRYRFGIWEEHGYPGHPITPYFYRPIDGELGSVSAPWRLTSCNGSEILGVLKPVNRNSSTLECYLHNFDPLDKTCRFHPHTECKDNHVNTSIMNFPWVTSVEGLCDVRTHETHAPNRQNLYCNYRGVWEVIRSSEDWTKKQGTVGTMPKTEFNVVIPNSKPVLYILLDLSNPDFDWRDKVYNLWMAELEAFVNALPSDVYVAFASYPNLRDSSTDLLTVLEWTLLDDMKKKEILRVCNFTLGTGLANFFDFRLPLTQVLSELKQKAKSSSSTLLLVLRTETIHFGEYKDPGLCEEDFILELRQNTISLYAVDTNIYRAHYHPYNMKLEYLASKSGGLYAEIVGPEPESEEEMAGMHSVLMAVLDKLTNSKIGLVDELEQTHEIIYKEMLYSNISEKSVLIPQPTACDMDIVHVYVTVAGARLETVELMLGEHGNGSHLTFSSRQEWFPQAEEDDPRLYRTYSTSVNVSEFQGSARLWELQFFVQRLPGSLKGTITVYGVKATGSSRGCQSRPTLKAEIFTSTDADGKFGCVSRVVNEEPLSIYVRLTAEGGHSNTSTISKSVPVFLDNPHNSSCQLSVLLLHLRTGTSITTALHDDGLGADLLAGDGLYSAYVYPNLKDAWKLYVTVYDITNGTSVDRSHVINPIGRIHSAKQDNLEVTVKGTTLGTPYSSVFETPKLVRVTSECVAKRYISRVVDTQVAVLDIEKAEFVKVTFTSPVVTASEDGDLEDETDISGYFIGMAYMAEDLDTLIKNLTHESVHVQGFLIPSTSGKPVEGVQLKRGNATAYAMVLIDPGQLPTKSPVSNIVQIGGLHLEQVPGGKVECVIGCMLLVEIASGLVISILIFSLLLLWRKNRRQATKLRMLSRNEIKEFLHGQKLGKGEKPVNPVNDDGFLDLSERIQCLPYDSKFEIPNNKLHIDKTELLGSGTFGNVYKGYVVNHGVAGMAGKVLVVAVKTMKPDMDKSNFKVLLAEVKLMTHIEGHHPNIIRLVGACTKNIRKCEVFLATEFCSNGNLSSYLTKLNGRTVSTWMLTKWAREIANGLEFLGRNKIIHGDLATRNILLDETLVSKVSDFGLSKQSKQYTKQYKEEEGKEDGGGGLLPWKWVAPEVLTFGNFSVCSDVWSYGVTLWEVFSLGQVPYPGIQWSPDFVHKLEHKGLRLLKPTFATDSVYDIMTSCWALEPRERPGFNKLKAAFDQMMIILGEGEYLDLEVVAESHRVADYRQRRISYVNTV